MKKLFATIAMVGAMSSAAIAQEYTRITTEAQYRNQVVGRTSKIVGGNLTVVVRSDGTISGDMGGTTIAGTWRWSGDQYCSTVVIGNTARPEACKIIAISGNRLLVRTDEKDVFYDLN